MGKAKKDPDESNEGTVGRPKRRHSSEVVLPPAVLALASWTIEDDPERLTALVVPGPTHFDRQQVLKQYRSGDWAQDHSGIVVDTGKSRDWMHEPLADHFLGRVARLSMPTVNKGIMAKWHPAEAAGWEVLWNLIAVDEFVVEDPLRQLLDKSFYLVHDVHRALWEARFLARENDDLGPVRSFLLHFTRWISGEPLGDEGRKTIAALGIKRTITQPTEKFDIACLLLSLACQNGLLERAIFVFDDLEDALQPNKRSALRQLRDLLECVRRWSKLGSNPIGVLIGFSGSRSDLQLLQKYNSSLASDVNAGLAWTRRTLSS